MTTENGTYNHKIISHYLCFYAKKEAAKLSLQIITTDEFDNIFDPFIRVLLICTSLRLDEVDPLNYQSGLESSVISSAWRECKPFNFTKHFSHIFPTELKTQDNPCYALYQRLEKMHDDLISIKKCKIAMSEFVTLIRECKNHLYVLHEKNVPCEEFADIPQSAYGITKTKNTLDLLDKRWNPREESIKDTINRFMRLLRLAYEICNAEIWFPKGIDMKRISSKFFSLDDNKIKAFIREMFDYAPDNSKDELVRQYSHFTLYQSDRKFFTYAIEQNVPFAIIASCNAWPDTESIAMIKRFLDSALEVGDPGTLSYDEKRQKHELNSFGKMVSYSITAAITILPKDELYDYYKRFLLAEDLEKLKIEFLAELDDCDDPKIGGILAQCALTANGWLLSNIAEAIERNPTDSGLDALSSRLLDQSLRLDRLPVIDTLASHRPDNHLKSKLCAILEEQGCRCGGCVWRKAVFSLASHWTNEETRTMLEKIALSEPSFEGKSQILRALAIKWRDSRTFNLLNSALLWQVNGSGEGNSGHLPFDGLDNLSDDAKQDYIIKFSQKLHKFIQSELLGELFIDFNHPN
jgi:hypothetical protein